MLRPVHLKYVLLFHALLFSAALAAQCTNYTISAGGDLFDSEISWTLTDAAGVQVAADVATPGIVACLDDGCYTLTMIDSWGDGWGTAVWTITDPSGTVLYTETLAGGGLGTASIGLNDPLCGAPPCPDYVTISWGGGGFDDEISWSMVDDTGAVVASGAVTGSTDLCLPDGCYTVTLNDTWGDGWNGATWTMVDATGAVLTNETLAVGFTTVFDAGINDPTCNPLPCLDAYTFTAGGGTFDGEISWTLTDESGAQVYGGNATGGSFFCLTEQCYLLELYDSFADSWNGATWTLTDINGAVIGTGGLAAGGYGYAQIAIGAAVCEPFVSDAIIIDTGSYSASELISDVFLGDCLEASNISYTGNAASIGTFSNGGAIGIENGIILTTGTASEMAGPNISGGMTTGFFGAGDALLESISGFTTYDAAVFEFDFVASTEEVTFTYVFASEEYPEFVCGSYNDAFGFFVTGPGYAANTNIASVPGTTDLVSIDNINDNGTCPPTYPEYYLGNAGGTAIEFDGYTIPMVASISTVPCETYQIKIAVADAGDDLLDSGVLLAAESFNAGIDLAVAAASPSGGQSDAGNCEDLGSFVFLLNGDPLDVDAEISFTIGGSASSGTDYDALPTTITIPAGSTSYILDVAGYLDQLDTSPESVTLTLDNVCSCSASADITLFLCSLIMLSAEELNLEATLDPGTETVDCQWSSAGALEGERFRLQRTLDGETWTDLTEVFQGDGVPFVFTDHAPIPGWNYYRVVRTDLNGNQASSQLRSVEWWPAPAVQLAPNPCNGAFGVINGKGLVPEVRDAAGRLVAYRQLSEGRFNLLNAAAGVYTVLLRNGDAVVTVERLILQ